MHIVRNNVTDGAVRFLIIDDSLSKKDKSTKKIEGLDYHHSHSDGKVSEGLKPKAIFSRISNEGYTGSEQFLG